MMKMTKGFVIGLLFASVLVANTLANTVKEYVLVPALYPILVNGTQYQGELPILNYEGHTYIPLRVTTNLLGAGIDWNEGSRQVEITSETSIRNDGFRNILISGSGGYYTVAGEARAFEATVQYEVEDGHFILEKGYTTASQGGPEWGIFKIDIHVPAGKLPNYGHLRLVLFEESAKDGSKLNELSILLENFNQ